MGDTVWVLPEGAEDDQWDHSLVLREEDELKALSKSLGVPELGSYFDFSIVASEHGTDIDPTHSDPESVETTLSAIIEAIETGEGKFGPQRRSDLVEELMDIRSKVKRSREAGVRVRLAVVP